MATLPVDVNSPYVLDISLLHGKSYRRLWTLERTSTVTAAVSLTGVTWTLKIYDAPSGGTAKLSKTTTADFTASGIYVDSEANGQFTVYLLAADVETFLPPGSYYYEVTATFGASHADFPSQVKTLLKGSLTITADLA